MGLYNAVFGELPYARMLVELLHQVQPIDVGRYRDSWVERDSDGLFIHVYTRNGGGNRADYQLQIESMQAHPWYERDNDDDFDVTYANFYFKLPEDFDPGLRQGLNSLAVEPIDMSARWQTAIDALKNS